jgi:DNA-binding LacI/PurR family transcriptional regulator
MKPRKSQKRQVTLSDIAASAGVATMTVSRVVNQSGYVHPETRDRVLQVVREMNYRRNHLARALKRQRTDTIGLVLGDIANPYAAELARAVRERMADQGFTLFICVSEHSPKEDVAAFEALTDHRVDGIIVATRASKLGNDRLAQMVDMGIPVVLLGREFHHPTVDFVGADHLKGGYEATTHLIQLGHKRVGFIGVSLTNRLGLKRFQGYLDALRERGLPIEEKLIVGGPEGVEQSPGYSTEEMGYEGMKKLLSRRPRPTAVFARNDFTAMGAISAIKEAGLRIPEDIAIVGYDDVPLARHTSPGLTTVRQPTREQGHLAAEFLLRRIGNDPLAPRAEKILECELVIRESTSLTHKTSSPLF